MPPNTIEIISVEHTQGVINGTKPKEPSAPVMYKENYGLMVLQSSLNLLAHILIGITVCICIAFAFRNGLPLGATPMHVVLCVIGYQLLMAVAILSLSTEYNWTSKFRLIHKKRAHWILQVAGSGLAIGGSIHKILDKTVHWDTLHGQFGLVALVFTTVSLVNGVSSLWAYELRRVCSSNLSKLTHICFGTVAFTAAGICLCYGMDKNQFRNWITTALADTFIAFNAILIFIVIVNPLINLYSKSMRIIKK